MLNENFKAPQQPEQPCCDRQIPSLISSVQDLVNALSSNTPTSAATAEAFGVKEAASRLGCSPGQVRKLVHDGKLGHHRLGKNIRFLHQDLEDFWASQTRRRADKTLLSKSSGSCELKRGDSATKKHKKGKSSPILTRKEVNRLWQS